MNFSELWEVGGVETWWLQREIFSWTHSNTDGVDLNLNIYRAATSEQIHSYANTMMIRHDHNSTDTSLKYFLWQNLFHADVGHTALR